MDEDRQSGADGAGHPLTAALRARLAHLRLPRRGGRMPRRVRRNLAAHADAWVRAELRQEPEPRPALKTSRSSGAGWVVAALCGVLAIVGWWPRIAPVVHDVAHGISPLQPRVEQDRRHLLHESGPSLGRWPWVHESGLPAGIAGEVIWDSHSQQGYLTLAGAAPTVGTGQQYQLWIFDAARDDRYPVDGGVFDVPVGSDEVTVAVRAALPVSRPTAFAITRERAGGVVVSDRSHLVALARVTGAAGQ